MVRGEGEGEGEGPGEDKLSQLGPNFCHKIFRH
jgi:hypothetical protein